MEQTVPWDDLCTVIEPHYPKAGDGRPPVGLQRMLRMYFVQHGFNLADAACEDALLDSTALRRFVGIDRVSRKCTGDRGQPSVPTNVPTARPKKNRLRHLCCNPLILLAEWTTGAVRSRLDGIRR